jgi:hypothetical protein
VLPQARAAAVLNLPVVVTEQYPKALGSTVAEVAEVLPEGSTTVAKTDFSMLVPEVVARLAALPAVRSVLVVGIETHVCVLQSSLDLLGEGARRCKGSTGGGGGGAALAQCTW